METKLSAYRQEMAAIVSRHMKRETWIETAVPSLYFVREFSASEPSHIFQKPSLCIILQGKKEICLAKECFQYGPSEYLISAVGLPVIGQIMEATETEPYISLKLEFTMNQIVDLIHDKYQEKPKKKPDRAIYVSPIEVPLMDAVARLVRLVDTPDNIDVLAPIYIKEILYYVLIGPHGHVLRQFAMKGSTACQIQEIVQYVITHYNETIRVEELAEKAKVSVPTLHRQFKEVTAMSPLQFQKKLRLQEARLLLLKGTINATDVAFQVGYESPSQFSREYSRMFGCPPKKDSLNIVWLAFYIVLHVPEQTKKTLAACFLCMLPGSWCLSFFYKPILHSFSVVLGNLSHGLAVEPGQCFFVQILPHAVFCFVHDRVDEAWAFRVRVRQIVLIEEQLPLPYLVALEEGCFALDGFDDVPKRDVLRC